ncbi:MAG: hypothetical protein MR440_03055 [Firmicutes bacterium]|nr:hypothetical protein [Bacillota bacterium]
MKDGAKKIDDASEELKEKVAELSAGTGKINDGAGELPDGLTQITGKNAELINGAYSAFVGICSASENILKEQLTANGMGKVSLTPTTYSKVLNDLLETLDPAAVIKKHTAVPIAGFRRKLRSSRTNFTTGRQCRR